MRRVLLVVALLATVAVAGWSIATTRPAGVSVGPVAAGLEAPVAADAPGPDGGATAAPGGVSAAASSDVDLPPGQMAVAGSAARQPTRLLLPGAGALAVVLALLGLVRRPGIGRRPVLRHRLRRALAPFSVAALRGPPAGPTRLLHA